MFSAAYNIIEMQQVAGVCATLHLRPGITHTHATCIRWAPDTPETGAKEEQENYAVQLTHPLLTAGHRIEARENMYNILN